MEKLLQLLEFPVLSIVSPIVGVVAGGVLAYMQASAKLCVVVLGALALVMFVYCSIFEGVQFPSVTVPGFVFGLLAVPMLVVPGTLARLVLSKWLGR